MRSALLLLGRFLFCRRTASRAGGGTSSASEAAKSHKEDPAQAKKARDEKETGQILGLDKELGIWSILIFVVLLWVLKRYAWGPMLEGLHKREQTISLAIEEGKRTRTEMEQLRARFKAEMEREFAKIPQMMDEARRNGEKLAAELWAKATAEIQGEKERGKRELESARDQLLQDLTSHTAQLATLISANVLARTLTPEDHNRLLALAVDELKANGQKMRQET